MAGPKKLKAIAKTRNLFLSSSFLLLLLSEMLIQMNFADKNHKNKTIYHLCEQTKQFEQVLKYASNNRQMKNQEIFILREKVKNSKKAREAVFRSR